ncbi:hypothetical protein ACXJJ3_18080 [Kribbella sp. WER1]
MSNHPFGIAGAVSARSRTNYGGERTGLIKLVDSGHEFGARRTETEDQVGAQLRRSEVFYVG